MRDFLETIIDGIMNLWGYVGDPHPGGRDGSSVMQTAVLPILVTSTNSSSYRLLVGDKHFLIVGASPVGRPTDRISFLIIRFGQNRIRLKKYAK